MTRFQGVLAVLILLQCGWGADSHATPGCSSISSTAANCQYHYSAADSGTVNGSVTAPQPAFGGSCASPPCSDGIRQDAGVKNILYNAFYPGTTVSTTTTCRFIDNNNSGSSSSTGDLFVPQYTLNEFTKFVLSAPGITTAYCVQGESITYDATATYGPGFELLGAGTPPTPTLVDRGTRATSTSKFTLPTTRESYTVGETVTPTPPSCAGSFCYNRLDCIEDAAGHRLCNTQKIVETQAVTYTADPITKTDPNYKKCQSASVVNVDCDGSWVSSVVISCTVNGVPYGTGVASCLGGFAPPAALACSANGTTYPDGSTYQIAATGVADSTSTPPSPECPAGDTGTQTCTTNFDYDYVCNDGVGKLTGTTTPVINVASCTGCIAPCTVFGCGGISGAHVSLYRLTPTIDNPNGNEAGVGEYAGLDLSGSTALITAEAILPYTFNTTVLDVPDQSWTMGFPGYPNLTEWFGLCYDAGFNAPTTGDYTFVAEVDDGVAMWIDGKFVFDDEDGVISTPPKGITTNEGGIGDVGGHIIAIPPVHLTAGMHSVMIKYYQGWPSQLGVVLWALPPGAPAFETNPPCSPEIVGSNNVNLAACPVPGGTYAKSNPYLMQLTSPPGGVINCPQ